MSKIISYWDSDCYGQAVLVVEKKRGSISQEELADHLLYERKEYGYYVNILNANENVCGGSGWPDTMEHKGDRVCLYKYEPGEEGCPVCSHMAVPNYCVKCGHYIDLEKDYSNPIREVRGGIETRQPLYVLAYGYSTEGGCGFSGIGVSKSIDGIMQLMHENAKNDFYVPDDDPFFKLPAPSPTELPASIKYEWHDGRLQVEYIISIANAIF